MAVNPLLAILSGVSQGFAEDQKRQQEQAYRKALTDQIKTQAKLEEQKINLMSQKEMLEGYKVGEAQKLIAAAVSGQPYQPGAPPQMPASPMQGQPMTPPEQPQPQGLVKRIVNLAQGNPQKYESMPGVPYGIVDIVHKVAQTEGIPPALLASVIKAESKFNPAAVSPKGAQGLMQLMPETAQGLGVTDPMDPAQNVAGGARYLKSLLQKYNNNLPMALAAYNWGEGNLEKYGLQNIPAETRNYIATVTGGVKQSGQQAGLIAPISGRVTSGYTDERVRQGVKGQHYGYDISAPAGAPFVAPTNLKVTAVRDKMSDSPGGMVWAVDQNGLEHRFHHVQPGVKVGDVIEQGKPLGKISPIQGSHLDYKIHNTKTGQYVDVNQILQQPQPQPQQPQPGQTEQGQQATKRPLLSPRDQLNLGLQMLGAGKLGEGKAPVKVDTGTEILLVDPDNPSSVLQRYPKAPETLMQPYADKSGAKYVQPMTKPMPGRPSEPLGTPYMTEPGPMQSMVPMTPKDREDLTNYKNAISDLDKLASFANKAHVFGPGNDILMGYLTAEGPLSKVAQAYAGPKEDLIAFRTQLEKFNSMIRKELYAGSLTTDEAAKYQKQALNARNPQEFMIVLNQMKESIQKKAIDRINILSGTQQQYLEKEKQHFGQTQKEPVKIRNFDPATGRFQ